MKRLLTVLLLLTAAAFAQGVRIGDGTPVASTLNLSGVGNILTPSSTAAIAICTYPANAVPCTNKATTYTTQALSVACATSVQVTLPGATSCVANADALGNWGAWVADGTYDYTITVGSHSYGPYTVSSALPGWSAGAVIKNPTADQAITGFLFTVPDLITKNTPVYDVRGYASVQAAITAAGAAGGGTVLLPSGSYSISTGLTLTQNNVTVECGAGTTITRSANVVALTITATNVKFGKNCTLNGGSFASDIVKVLNSTNVEVSGLNVTATTGTQVQGITVDGSINVRVHDNTLTTTAMTVKNASVNVMVRDNSVDLAGWTSNAANMDAMAVSTQGSAMSDIRVIHNYFKMNYVSFCIEAGVFGGGSLDSVSVKDNICEFTADQVTYGGVSTPSGTNVVVSGNKILATPVTAAATIAAFEMGGVGQQNYGNTVLSGGLSGYSVNTCRKCSVIGNFISGAPLGIVMTAPSGAGSSLDYNIISNNTIVAGSGTAKGIQLACNPTNGALDCNNNILSGNSITGNGGVASNGIEVTKGGAAPLDGTLIANNQFFSLSTGLVATSDTSTTVMGNKFATVTTPYNIGSQGTGANYYDLPGKFNLDTNRVQYDFTNHIFKVTTPATDTANFNRTGDLVFQNTDTTNNTYFQISALARTNTIATGIILKFIDQTNNYGRIVFATRDVGGFHSSAFTVTEQGGIATGGALDVTGLSTLTTAKIGASGSTLSDSRELVQSVHDCGTTTTCANTANLSEKIVRGTVPLSSGTPSTAVVTAMTAFGGNTAAFYSCWLTNETTAANGVKYARTSSSSITITGPNTVTDVISYLCIGH